MKNVLKFFSVALTVILLALMVVTTFAEDVKYKIDPRFLEEYGQKTYIVGEPIATAPIIDGSVKANEYSIKEETTLDTGYTEQTGSNTGAEWSIEWAKYYVAYDDECLYLAAEVHDPDHTTYGQWADNVKRGDQFCFALGGMWQEPASATWDPITSMASRLEFRFFDGNTEEKKAETGFEDFFEIQDMERDFMGAVVTGEYYDVSDFTKAHNVVYDETTQVCTYEVAIKWDALKTAWAHHEGALQFDLITFGVYIQDSINEEIPADQNDGKVMGHRTGIRWWGNTGEAIDGIYNALLEEYTSAAKYGSSVGYMIPNMLFLGTQEEYDAYKAANLVEDISETEAPETEAPETEAPAGETEAPAGETNAPETNAPTTGDEKGGCGSSVAAVGVALVAALGTCTVFASKKR